MTTVDLHVGDCIDVLRTLPDSSVDSVVTSPPYAMQRASTYGGIPEKDYPEWTVAWMEALKPALTERGSVMINISPHVKDGMLSDYVLRTRLALRDAGWYEHDELVWHKTSAMPGGAPNRPVRAWESIFWYSLTPKPFGEPRRNGKPFDGKINARNTRAQRLGWGHAGGIGGEYLHANAKCRNVVQISNRKIPNEWPHPAPFPWQLAEWCGKLITPEGGTILDPFTGSSSTGVAAIKNGWDFIGIDQSQEYIEMSRKRLAAESAKLGI